MLIGDLIRRRALVSPELEFWRDRGISATYGKLDRDAARIARALLAENLRPGDHVAVCSSNSYEYAAVQFGAAKAGLVLAHLGARLDSDELTRMVDHCDATLVFVGAGQLGMAEQARGRMTKVRSWIALPDGESGIQPPLWAESLVDWIEPQGEGEPDLTPFAVRPGSPAVFPESPFQLLYTSGTTGFPKGALISHRAKLSLGATHAVNLGLQPGDRVWSTLPLSHQFAQWLVTVSLPLTGAMLVAAPVFDPLECWEELRGGGITHLAILPAMLNQLLAHPAATGAPPPDLRMIVYGGAPIEAERISAIRICFPGARLFQGYGQTEVGYCLGLFDGDHQVRPESLGKPDIFSRVKLVDEEGGEVPVGGVGEIVAETPYLMNGYYKEIAATQDFFSLGGEWGRTGDLAVRDEAGYYIMAGRKNDLIISGGVNIYPSELERVLTAHPAVSEAAVFGVPDDTLGEAVHAAVVLRNEEPALEEQLKLHCRENLEAFKIPRGFSFLTALPRTYNGKVRKNELRAPFWNS